MREIAIQTLPEGNIRPFSEEDIETLKEYPAYQVLRCKASGVRKQRSYQQLKMFWGCCKAVAENTEDTQWDTKDKVAFQVKVALHFVDPDIVVVTPAKRYTKELEVLRVLYKIIEATGKFANCLEIIKRLGERLKRRDEVGKITFCYRSISYKELPHMEACNFFDNAFEIMAKKLGITVDELLNNSEG